MARRTGAGNLKGRSKHREVRKIKVFVDRLLDREVVFIFARIYTLAADNDK